MARTVGVGVVGAGWMGRVHSSSYRRVAEHYPDCPGFARLVAVADESEPRVADAAAVFKFEEATTEWRAVVEHPQVEGVSIALPNVLHREVAIAAAEAGKHVWIEKPAGRLPEDTAAIADAFARAGVRSLVGFNYRQAPAVREAHRLIHAGALGTVSHFRSQWLAAYAASPRGALTWRFRREDAGLGVLGDLGAHAVDLAQFLLGPIAAVTARTETIIRERPLPAAAGTHFATVEGGELATVENDDVLWSLVRFASGATGTIEASRVAVGPQARYTFEAHGSQGALAWDFERMNELWACLGGEDDASGYTRVVMGPRHPPFERFHPGPGIPMGYDDLKVTEAAAFLESMVTGAQAAPGIEEALAAARVVAALERSAASGTWEDVGDLTLSSF
jgi:predicted dehydrogenase